MYNFRVAEQFCFDRKIHFMSVYSEWVSESEHSPCYDKYWQYGIISSAVLCHVCVVVLHEQYAKLLHGEDTVFL